MVFFISLTDIIHNNSTIHLRVSALLYNLCLTLFIQEYIVLSHINHYILLYCLISHAVWTQLLLQYFNCFQRSAKVWPRKIMSLYPEIYKCNKSDWFQSIWLYGYMSLPLDECQTDQRPLCSLLFHDKMEQQAWPIKIRSSLGGNNCDLVLTLPPPISV